MLKVSDLDVAIGTVQVLRAISLEVPSGVMAGLIGRNGAGKTTLMRSIMGLLEPAAGAIEFEGRPLTAMPTHSRTSLGIGYMPEDRRLIPELTVEENLLLPAWALGTADSAVRLAKIYQHIPELVVFAQRKALQLSGGQQKLVALGRAMMVGTKLLLLDEPFEGVAPALAQRLVEVISTLKGEGLSVIMSESDFQHSSRLVDRVFTIDRGVLSVGA
ncbi:MAG: ATP-binding cassette domain-containing protein [Burkholderiaceae bacterium]